jgi:hypothetical protein
LFISSPIFSPQEVNYTTPVTKNINEMELPLNTEFTPKTTRDGVRVIRGRLVTLHNPRGRFDILGPNSGVFGGQNLESETKFHCGGKFEVKKIRDENEHGDENVNENESENESGNENENIDVRLEVKVKKDEEYYKSNNNREMEHIQTLHNNNNINNNYNNKNSKNINININRGQKVQLNNIIKTTSATTSFCEVLADGSPYDTASSTFFGTVISRGQILQSSEIRNVHFGIRNNSYFVGYLKFTTSLASQGKIQNFLFSVIKYFLILFFPITSFYQFFILFYCYSLPLLFVFLSISQSDNNCPSPLVLFHSFPLPSRSLHPFFSFLSSPLPF